MGELDASQLRELCEALGWQGGTFWQVLAAVREQREAARQFHNLTQGDPEVIIRPPSAKKRDAIIAAGERLRAAISAANHSAYRLVGASEIIRLGDEVLSDDAMSWIPLSGWEIGMHWHSGLMPMRRRTYEAQEPEAPSTINDHAP